MDETTFQKELHELKKCVTEIANTPSPTLSAARLSNYMSANAVHNDMFVAQLRDVRTRLDIMQASMLQHGRGQATEVSDKPQSVNDHGDSNAFKDLSLNVHALQDTIVRCHRDTNDRISRLEQAVSCLDGPVIYTPTSSETTAEDLAASQEACANNTSIDFHEPKSAASLHNLAFAQNEQDRPATLSQILEESWTKDDSALQPFLAVCPSNIGHRSEPQLLSDFLNDSTTLGKYDQLHEASSVHRPELAEPVQNGFLMSSREEIYLPQNEMGWLQDMLPRSSAGSEARPEITDAALRAKDDEISHLNMCRAAAEEAAQITRTDLENRLAENESELARWKDEAKAAHKGFEAMARCNRELQEARDHAIGRLRQDLQHCEESRHHFMTKYVDENYRFKWLEQRKLQSEQKLHQRLDECERALDSSERHREADVRAAVHSRDDDLEQLYAFCQEKADVVSHQEQIIAQGTSIIHERDAEIDRLNVALAESQRGREYVREHAGKLKRVIKKREDEIVDLKRKVKDERDRRHRLEDSMERDAHAKRSKPKDVRFDAEERKLLDMKQSAETTGRSQIICELPSWTPQPINSSRLPHEEDRASLWQDGARSTTEHKFGSASPIARRRNPDARHGMSNEHVARDNGDAHAHPSVSFDLGTQMMPDNQRTSSAAIPFDEAAFRIAAEPYEDYHQGNPQREGYLSKPPPARQEARVNASDSRVIGGRPSHSGMKAQGAANSGSAENRRHALPLDATWLPPLPAGTSASAVEKVSSVPNLRAGSRQSRSHDAGAISKPASMLNLRPQSYAPPSVETEAESAEDQGGSSLTDC
jgi:hypothetical protein